MKNKFLCLFVLIGMSTSACNLFPTKNSNKPFSIVVNNNNTTIFIPSSVNYSDIRMGTEIETLPPFEEYTFKSLPDAEILDNEQTFFYIGQHEDSMSFFKYTFYMKNIGTGPTNVDMAFTFSSNNGNTRLADTLRYMIFENRADSEKHEYKVYAKEAAEYNIDKDGNRTRREFVSSYPYLNQEDDEHPLAELFYQSNVITKRNYDNFQVGDFIRYTVVIWLEGEDPQSYLNMEAPSTEYLYFKISITAHDAK